MIKKEQPKEAVARWVLKYADDYYPPNVHEPLIFTEASHIEDKLTFDIEDLLDPDPILIQAPTGFGKTWWIINVVLPVVVQLGGLMLIASNRTAASIQQKMEVAKKVEGKDTKWAKRPHSLVIKDWEDFGPVKVMTLQRLNEFLKTEAGRAYAKKVSVVVLDECQRFRFTENSIFMRILREGRKYHFSGWFASQWIRERGTAEALDQAALKALFYPGEERINALARRLACGGDSASDYKKLLRNLGVGEFLYIDSKGNPIINCVPRMEEGRERAK